MTLGEFTKISLISIHFSLIIIRDFVFMILVESTSVEILEMAPQTHKE